MKGRFLLLLIMDGWGISDRLEGNAVKLAQCQHIPQLAASYPYTELAASGLAVGLPEGVMGNSEVGHLNIGAGRVVWQEITRIDRAIQDGTFFTNPELLAAMKYVRKHNTALHLIGLVSQGYVHSSDRHYFALLQMAKRIGLPGNRVFFHAALDGRDTPPTSGKDFISDLVAKMKEIGVGQIATISGRYYLMDRDQRWERVKLAYEALTVGKGYPERDPVQAVINAYQRGETDEFIKPIVLQNENNLPVARIKDGDAVIFFNFRADRVRQITQALIDPHFPYFPRQVVPHIHCTTMTMYDEKFKLPVAFKPLVLENILGEVLARNNLKQLRIAETEKYPHVTYFFNGGEEKLFPGEDRILVPSPKVPTYDMQPEMSAPELTRRTLEAIASKKYDVIILNFANGDMVGHTGVLQAAIKAVQCVDESVGRIVAAVRKQKGIVLVTADHGNVEEMIDLKTKGPHTYHTTNPVPFILVADDYKKARLKKGRRLCDIAPTILELLGILKPKEMEGESLLIRRD